MDPYPTRDLRTHILRLLRPKTILYGTLRPKYQLYGYMEPLGLGRLGEVGFGVYDLGFKV